MSSIRKIFLVIALLFLGIVPTWAQRLQDGGSSLQLPSDKPVLFVTHGTSGYDKDSIAKPGIDRTVRVFKEQGWPIIYLNDCSGKREFAPYMADSRPTADVCSSLGEHEVQIPTQHIFVTGGYLDGCSFKTVQNALTSAFSYQQQSKGGERSYVVLHYISDGIYDYVYRSSRLPLLNEEEAMFWFRILFGASQITRLPTLATRPEIKMYLENSYQGEIRPSTDLTNGELLINVTTSLSLEKNPLAYLDFFKPRPVAYANPIGDRSIQIQIASSQKRIASILDWSQNLHPHLFDNGAPQSISVVLP